MEEQSLDKVIWKFLKGESTLEEDRKLLAWAEEDPAHLKYFNDIRTLARFRPAGDTQLGDPRAIMTGIRKKQLRTAAGWITATAACVALVFMVKGLLSRDLVREENLASVEKQITLPDQTQVLLGKNSTISFHEARFLKKRSVCLNGEADFVVSKDVSHPFQVHSPSLEITVLGTVFNVRDYSTEPISEATLAEGSISLKTNSGRDSYQISVGQHLIYNENCKTVQINESPIEEILLRRYGITMMKNMTVPEIVAGIIRDFDVQIDIPDIIAADNRRFTLSYKKDASPEQVLTLLKAVSGYQLHVNTYKP